MAQYIGINEGRKRKIRQLPLIEVVVGLVKLAQRRDYITPLPLRTGFLHSYKRTIILWMLLLFVPNFILLVGGIPIPLVEILGNSALTVIIIMGTWTVRYATDGFDMLFDIFDKPTEKKLKLYCSLDRYRDTDNPIAKSLFIGEKDYDNFKKRVRMCLFDRKEQYLVALGVLLVSILVLDRQFNQVHWGYMDYLVFPYTHLHEVFWDFIILPICVGFAVSAIWLAAGYLRILLVLDDVYDSTKLGNLEMYINKGDTKSQERILYQEYYSAMREIGEVVYSISGRVLVVLLFSTIWFNTAEAMLQGNTTWYTWLSAVIAIPIGLLILAIPQYLIHHNLEGSKKSISRAFERHYNNEVHRIIESVFGKDQTKDLEYLESSRIRLETIGLLLNDIKDTSTYSIGIPDSIKYLGATISPIIIESIIAYLLLTLI